ncbi:RNA methyltransferase [Aquimarina sp. AD10]|uniref:TrmH family RNA methyltransferase n=1 Tax=Aquimarina sp. AD10 TaxID=1714849 RepID=UPI000E53A1D2|nr:TrmH family RNA methyltransferase [Aquimarina sp. AD10]AXT60083.1 RNA methyltransferase [Aquimarina sp. AD10]RKM96225.1 RNA methyltransferase [Aquimarina sp. AD10]
MSEQLHHGNQIFTKKQFPITLICDQVNSPANIGSLFRIADSFGIEQIYFCGNDIKVTSKRMQRTARSTHEIVPYHKAEKTITIVKNLKAEGYTIIALEITGNSIPVSLIDAKLSKKIAIVIGEENFGVSEDVLNLADQSIHINMYGNNSSMNVATATGIALYEITKQMLTP